MKEKNKKKANWQELLIYIFDKHENWSYFTKDIKNKPNNKIEEDLKQTHRQFQSSFYFLIDQNLIELNKNKELWKISKKGLM